MNVTDYTYLINKPDAITEKQTEALGNVLIEFPYFQSARALRLKGLYNQNSFKYNYALKVTAAHTTDRSVLFDFITSETFTSIQNEFYDRKLRDLLNINVLDSEIVLAEETRKIPEARIDPLEQSILTSIKQATSSFSEEPKVDEKFTEAEIDEPNSIPVTETPSVEKLETEEKSEHGLEETISSPTEVPSTVVVEEFIKTEEQPIIEPAETSVEETPVIFEEEKNQEQPIETIKEEVLLPVKEKVTFFDEVVNDETEEDIIDKPVLTPKEETTPIIEDKEKFREVRIDPIEESIYNSIKESTTVIFEESKPSEKIIVEEPAVIDELPKEVATVVFEEVKVTEEEKNEVASIILENPEIIEPDSNEIITVILEEPVFVEESETTNLISEEEKTIAEKPVDTFIEEAAEIKDKNTESQLEENIKIAEENLEIGKPLDFSVNEKHSFQEWLQLARPEPIDRTNEITTAEEKTEEIEEVKVIQKTAEPVVENVTEKKIVIDKEITEEDEKKKKAELIDKFIETNPKIPPIKPTPITLPSIQFDINQDDNSYLMTETLARVYLEQKKYTKAIQAYEILILKYPEKSSLFADRISDIKTLQQNNNNN